jgi:ABC-type branched-subunit amino acid transport system substrate-binding protein
MSLGRSDRLAGPGDFRTDPSPGTSQAARRLPSNTRPPILLDAKGEEDWRVSQSSLRAVGLPKPKEDYKMGLNRFMLLGLGPLLALACGASATVAQSDVSFTLKYGVLAGLTGDPAADGQSWNEATKLGIAEIAASLKRLNLAGIKVELTDSQDSQGNAQAGVEAAQKLVQIDGVNAIIGDFFSSVTSAVASSVAIPNHVLMFTGGTSPALSKLNTGSLAFLWQPVAADDVQGKVLARVIADALGKGAKVNVAARNDAYGTALSAVFRDAFTAGGGTIPHLVIYNATQPTLDTEAQQVVDGAPDGWLFVDFCPTFDKLTQPLNRTGKWDVSKSFGSDTLNDCAAHGGHNYPGLRATQANASSGASFPAFKAVFEKNAKAGVGFQAFTAEAFDSTFVIFLAALEAKSTKPDEIAKHIVTVTNDPGKAYTFEKLDDAIKAVLAGEKIHFIGATGPLNFSANGRVNSLAYDIWQHQPDGSAKVVNTISFQP